MKRTFSKVGFRLRALRRARHWTQDFLAAACQCEGFAVTRAKLAKYEIGLTEVPARFIPIFAHVLKANITELLPPIGNRPESKSAPEPAKIRNLTGQQVQAFRKKRKWSQNKLAVAVQKTGVPITREIIANLESRRTRVRDYQLVLFAKALQIPLDSLLPDEATFAESASTFSARHRPKIHSRSMG